MAIHPRDKLVHNPRLQCSCCGRWKRLHCKPYPSLGGYQAEQTFFGGCAYTDGDHLAGDHVDVCDDCCHVACQQIAIARAAG